MLEKYLKTEMKIVEIKDIRTSVEISVRNSISSSVGNRISSIWTIVIRGSRVWYSVRNRLEEIIENRNENTKQNK